MPYSLEEAKLKSDFYRNQLDSDLIEFENRIRDLKAKQQISGSADANKPLRGEDGKLLSFQSTTNVSSSAETDFENVRIPNEQQFFTGELDNSFTYYFQPEQDDSTDTGDTDDSETDEGTEDEVQFQANNRDYLIQVVNVYFDNNYTPLMSVELLHSKILDFFKLEGKEGGKNADGWKAFRLKKLDVKKFTKKGKRKKLFGGRRKRHNYRSLKKNINGFAYNDVINRQLYHTRRGQEIWLELGFTYVS